MISHGTPSQKVVDVISPPNYKEVYARVPRDHRRRQRECCKKGAFLLDEFGRGSALMEERW